MGGGGGGMPKPSWRRTVGGRGGSKRTTSSSDDPCPWRRLKYFCAFLDPFFPASTVTPWSFFLPGCQSGRLVGARISKFADAADTGVGGKFEEAGEGQTSRTSDAG